MGKDQILYIRWWTYGNRHAGSDRIANARLAQEFALPQQLPGVQPRNEGADPQHPVSPTPGTLPSCLAPERLEDLDSSFVNSELPHFRQDISSLLSNMSFSKTLPQDVQRNSNIGITILPRVYEFFKLECAFAFLWTGRARG